MNDTGILIVEDEAIIALDIERTIIKLGYSSLGRMSTYSGTIDYLSNCKSLPKIILLDINLSEKKNGIDIANYIKINFANLVQIIFITSFDDEETIKKAAKSNPQAYILKPFKKLDLKIAIELANEREKDFLLSKNKNNNFFYLKNDYYYDKLNKMLFYKSLPIKLTKNELIFIETLIKSNDCTSTFIELENNVWGDYSSRNLKQLVYRLRTKTHYDFLISLNTGYGLIPE